MIPEGTPARRILVQYRRESRAEVWVEVPGGMSDEDAAEKAWPSDDDWEEVSDDEGEYEILEVE